jgi:aminoglycoside phosphotransferase (APT) family kinase protein
LALWNRPGGPVGFPRIQAVTRRPGVVGPDRLADEYRDVSDRDLSGLGWYMTFALWKLAAIVEGAYTQFLQGKTTAVYARELRTDVPLLLSQAAAISGCA